MELMLHPKQAEVLMSSATEILFGGAAGPGKSHLLRVAAIVWCNDIAGLQVYLFRRTYGELWDNHMTGPHSFPAMLAAWVDSGKCKIVDTDIRFAHNGSCIHLRHCQYEKNKFDYHGAEMHVLLVDELTTFPKSIYTYLRGRVRMIGITVPQRWEGRFPRIVAGSNPGNIGHTWVKAAFVDLGPGVHQMDEDEGGMKRQFVAARMTDNPDLLRDDPGYRTRLKGLGSPELVRALEDGDWDIVAGGAVDDVWKRERHVMEPFRIPGSWRVDRSFDWGSSRPFSVGWWAESDGTDATLADGKRKSWPRGTLFRIGEWYGWNGKPNEGCRLEDTEIGAGIAWREKDLALNLGIGIVEAGPADSSIFDADPGKESIAKGIDTGYGRAGCFVGADKSPGSRIKRLAVLRRLLKAGLAERMEEPGIFFFDTCTAGAIRTLPTLPRDQARVDDVDTKAEDHAYDEIGYRVTASRVVTCSVRLEAA